MAINRRTFLSRSGQAGAAAVMASVGANPLMAQTKKKPNIVICFTDEMAFEHLGCYLGSNNPHKLPVYPTGNINSIAKNGVRFTNAYAAGPVCTAARYSLLTGRYFGRCAHAEFAQPTTRPYFIIWDTFLH